MHSFLGLWIVAMITAVCESSNKTVTVKTFPCRGTYSVADGSTIILEYNGDPITKEHCLYTIKGSDNTKEICSLPLEFIIDDSCQTEMEYHSGYYHSIYAPDEAYKCKQPQNSTFCTAIDSLVVLFRSNGAKTADQIKLMIYGVEKEVEPDRKDKDEDSSPSSYVIAGIITGVVVLAIIAIGIAIELYCRKRRRQRRQQVY